MKLQAPIFMLSTTKIVKLFLFNGNFLDNIALADIVYNIEAFYHPAKAGMVAVEVRSIVAAVADKKLRATRVAAGMRHA